ncbi:hypothetical protein MTR_1g087510 [Medicago truncatula]|uniref:Uncharacterized protein n=1 Tax=Medicago truncatula TaxID=3880 RepID=G7IDU3_MEDTR|nr:hypothetical protein MTR_1g087510 [Medicago truncatula]
MKELLRPSMSKNKEKRSEIHAKSKARDAAIERAIELGEEKNLENTREVDETICKPDDEEVPFDVYKNDFEVAVKKRNVKVYFTDGICMEMSWCILKALLHKECCCRTIVLMLTAHKLIEGAKIKLGVTGAANNRVVYLCAPPMLVLRTKMPPSASIGENGPSYQFKQYFWKN